MAKGRAALLRKLSKATASGVGNHFKDGRYRVAVKKMELLTGFKGDRFQATFVPVSAIKIPVQSVKTNEKLDIEPSPVGSDVDWLQMLDKEDSPGPGNIKKMLEELFGKKFASEEEYLETLSEVCDICMGYDMSRCCCKDEEEHGDLLKDPENAVRGMLIDMVTVRIETKTNKKEIVVHNWTHASGGDQPTQETLAWLDSLNEQKPVEPTQAGAAA